MNLVVGMSAAWITTRTNMARDADRFQAVTQTDLCRGYLLLVSYSSLRASEG